MAKLIVCKTCEKEIAASAKICPHCGAPNKKSSWIKNLLLVFLGIIAINLISGGAKAPSKAPKPEESAYRYAQKLDYRKAMLRQLESGTLLLFVGKIIQKVGDHGARISIDGDIAYLTFDAKPQIIEGDVVRIFGRYNGTTKFETVLGAEVELPAITVDYYTVTEPKN